MNDKKKLSLICFSGEFDKAVAAFTMATGAAATNYEVNMFFTFWGLNLIKKNAGRTTIGNGFLARAFNWLMGGRKNVPLSRMNFGGFSPRAMTYLMKKRNVATLEGLVEAALALNINLYICEMSMNILGMKKDDFIPEIQRILGVPSFLEISEGGETLFI